MFKVLQSVYSDKAICLAVYKFNNASLPNTN